MSNPSADAANAPLSDNNTNITDPTVEVEEYDPSKYVVNGVRFKIDKYLAESEASKEEECRFKKRSLCYVLKKAEHLHTMEDSYLYKCAACSNMTQLHCYRTFMVENGFNHILI